MRQTAVCKSIHSLTHPVLDASAMSFATGALHVDFCGVFGVLMHVVCKLTESGSGAVHAGLVNRNVNELKSRRLTSPTGVYVQRELGKRTKPAPDATPSLC